MIPSIGRSSGRSWTAFPDPVTMLIFNQRHRVRAMDCRPTADHQCGRAQVPGWTGICWTWDEDIPIAILKRNMQRAQDCRAFETAGAAAAAPARRRHPGRHIGLPALPAAVGDGENETGRILRLR
jgi:hypothetical protein